MSCAERNWLSWVSMHSAAAAAAAATAAGVDQDLSPLTCSPLTPDARRLQRGRPAVCGRPPGARGLHPSPALSAARRPAAPAALVLCGRHPARLGCAQRAASGEVSSWAGLGWCVRRNRIMAPRMHAVSPLSTCYPAPPPATCAVQLQRSAPRAAVLHDKRHPRGGRRG